MPKPHSDVDVALHKLGQRLREGFAKKHPMPEKSLETVKDAVREQYEQEQQAERENKSTPQPDKEREQQPPEPDHER